VSWRRRLLRWTLVGVPGLMALAVAASADVRFVLRAGYEEARILARRQPLDRLIADPATPPALRGQLELVRAARAFGADSLGLEAGETYTSYSDIGRDTLVLVLSASPRLQLADHLWWFPVVGAVPYHGYFSLGAATREMVRLHGRGFDTYLRPSSAFSTLGWFADPLVSTMTGWDPVSLASTVLHEITHNTVFPPSAVHFNESFANFAGERGAEAFFRSRGDTALAARAAAGWHDELVLGEFYRALAASLDSVYRLPVPDSLKLAGRDSVFAGARARLDGELRGRFRLYSADRLLAQPLNNATVVAARIYRTRLELFEAVLAAHGGNLRAAIAAVVETVAAGEGDPYAGVERLVPRRIGRSRTEVRARAASAP
jgi:predicted aminopeptidase